MIDCRSLTLDASRLALVTKAARRHRPPLALLVTPEQRDALALDGAYLDDVPVTTDAASIPPPKPAPPPPPPPVRPLADLQRERAAELQQEIRDHVDVHIPPSEREGLASIASGLAEKVAFGGFLTETEQTVALALMFARAWTNAATALGGEVAVQCNACTTVEQLQAVAVDLASLGPPPSITAGEVALMLRGA